MKSWPIINIESWKHFLEVIEGIKAHSSFLPYWVFRGQENSEWSLMPSLCRQFHNQNISKDYAISIEKYNLDQFIQNAPNFEDFKKSEHFSKNPVVWLSIMQHYGCSTRMLDWTGSPYVALYFAVMSSFDKDGALFLFLDSILRSEQRQELVGKEDKILEYPNENFIASVLVRHATKRSVAQQSSFTISANILADHYLLIDNVLSKMNENEKQYNAKLIIPKDLKREFLARLKSMNITANLLFPDLYGHGRYLSDLVEIRMWENQESNFKE